MRLHAVPDGSIVFPRTPLVILEGPLPVAQPVAPALPNAINYPSLGATTPPPLTVPAAPNPNLSAIVPPPAPRRDSGFAASRPRERPPRPLPRVNSPLG